ncbi:MAG TPA: 1-(5-phosphoribosyl)-5-[(5-phosphoribosylamino)methylideneamino]imidazole-4-carboxamide isomerase [Anaerolineales bacterium]
MSTFTIHPAIDLRTGRVVRLREGDPGRQTIYSDDPAAVAQRWLEAGAQWLHVVNLDGAFDQDDPSNQPALRAILEAANWSGARVQFGGGLRSIDMIQRAIDFGVSRVVLGTIAIEQPRLVADALTKFGERNVAVGIDARDGLVRVRGWQSSSGTTTTALATQMQALGVRTVIFTDISRDGVGRGLNISVTRQLADLTDLEVIASGGVRTLEDVIEARDARLAGVIIGRALYEGTVDLKAALASSVP